MEDHAVRAVHAQSGALRLVRTALVKRDRHVAWRILRLLLDERLQPGRDVVRHLEQELEFLEQQVIFPPSFPKVVAVAVVLVLAPKMD